ncbi:hypothetical protein OVY29_21380 [Sphingopyxis sp. SE2]|uniref:hypothetical protein n=1 Tax=Sphingopyxis sp. SE2 TaxID=1586240 RepID=UPI0028C0B6FB|nr:hypothetical protein [Sphingopyxis sp. SE2]MDT7531219.1 hypothetical protein [Sphingopyxis sp. SE2]
MSPAATKTKAAGNHKAPTRPAKPNREPPATLAIFAATVDLDKRLLMPSILNLSRDGLLKPKFPILDISHHDRTSW